MVNLWLCKAQKKIKVDRYLGIAAVFNPASSEAPLGLLGYIHHEQWEIIAKQAESIDKSTQK